MATRPELVDQNFSRAVKTGEFPPSRLELGLRPSNVGLGDVGLGVEALVDLFETQVMSRHMDFMARILREKGKGFYTIGSSGHEGVAAVAHAFKLTDMAFLHYRSAAFFIQRCKQLPGSTPLYDLLLSLAASADDPISGGRHKVLGSKAHFVPPQTSTIASHLPKAFGAAYAIPRAVSLGLDPEGGADAVSICSFGDASANHSTAQGAFNAAEWTAYQGVPLPLVFVCEDNGIGISVRTPGRWIEAAFSRRPVMQYLACDGLDLLDVYRTSRVAERIARVEKRPVFLHVKTVRLFGHAGADVETTYRSLEEIRRDEANDPLLHSARTLVENGILTPDQVLGVYESVRERVARIAEEVITRPKLKTAKEVMSSIVPSESYWQALPPPVSSVSREKVFAKDREAMRAKQHLARHLNWALADSLLQFPNTVILGEDVAQKGGVYNVTAGLVEKFGNRRVFNSLLDEQTILGVSMGMAHHGFVPIPEIQFLAYLHNAEDQIRGEAATLSFFSQSQYTNPMVVRIAGLPYQKGFGGHFHNDNSLAVLRDIPGIIIACPSNGEDAARMLRSCVRLAHEQRRVVVFIEPIALYMTRDLHAPGDLGWTQVYPEPPIEGPSLEIEPGQFATWGEGTDVCIVSYANGYYLARQAAEILKSAHGVSVQLIDLRWIKPLNHAALVKAASRCRAVLIVDECRITGSVSEELMAAFAEHSDDSRPVERLCAEDCFIPLGEGATITLPSRDQIVEATLSLHRRSIAGGAVPRTSEGAGTSSASPSGASRVEKDGVRS